MPNLTISRDHLNVLRLRRAPQPPISLDQQELIELSMASYGFLVQRGETLGTQQFIERIRSVYDGGERQRQIEEALLACEVPAGQALQPETMGH